MTTPAIHALERRRSLLERDIEIEQRGIDKITEDLRCRTMNRARFETELQDIDDAIRALSYPNERAECHEQLSG